MNDAEDDDSMVPTALDLQRLDDLKTDTRLESENGSWIVIKYPPKAYNPSWCEYSLIVNNKGLPPRGAPYELKNLAALKSFLNQLEAQRKK